MNYKIFSNIMDTFFNNQTFHSPTDQVIDNSKVVKKKYRYPCEKEEQILIDYHKFIFHHYQCRYKDIILYFPGGSFIDPPTILHYKFAKRIAKKLKKHVIMVQYPLYPEIDPYTTALLLIKIMKYKNIKKVTLMGDSAGANLAAFLLSALHNENLKYASNVIMISPWTNRFLKNEKIQLIRQYDFILNYENCKTLSEKVFTSILQDNQNIFPNNYSFKYDTNTLIISGEKEIFTPDIRLWAQKPNSLNIKHIIYKDMCHCFIILPCKQSKHALKKIDIFLKNS